MNLANQLHTKLADPTITYNDRAHLRCQISKELGEVGNYEGARSAMGELWQRIGDRPVLDNLDPATAAEVLLRAGVLTGLIGSAKQIEGAQEIAKNLISESTSIFENLQQKERVAETQIDLAVCYWRQGTFGEARIMLQEALKLLDDKDSELKARAFLSIAILERLANRLNDALHIYVENAPLFENLNSHVLKGKYHHGLGIVLEYLSASEHRQDYIDRALIEHTAASFHFEQAVSTRYQACVENNLGFLFLIVGKFAEAHDHLDRAQALFTSLKDRVHLAQVDDTRAKVFLAEGRVVEAERLARAAVKALEDGGEQALLAEALTTHGVVLARLRQHERAGATLRHAIEVAQLAGNNEGAAEAALTIIEELSDHLSNDELSAAYDRAAALLSGSQNLDLLTRLCAAARRVLFLVNSLTNPPSWKGFSFKEAVQRYEARLIERALRDSGGVVSRAAQLLGFRHHQSLINLLNRRHKNLLHARTTIVSRKRSIITARDAKRASPTRSTRARRTVTILYAEDDESIRNAVGDILASEGWAVQSCEDGNEALKRIESSARFDLLLLDNELPGVSGVELIRLARAMHHRHSTPIVLLSGSECESQARSAGADECLKKPEEIFALAGTITKLMAKKSKQK